MNRTDLEFLLAFADIEGLMDRPVTEVIELAIDFLNSDDYIECYLYHYGLMKEYHLDAEVKTLVNEGYDFFMACKDWDI